jgi:hypothetical protein
MINDIIIEKIHEIRRDHAKKFNFNVKAICEDYRKKENESKLKIVQHPLRKQLKLR